MFDAFTLTAARPESTADGMHHDEAVLATINSAFLQFATSDAWSPVQRTSLLRDPFRAEPL